MKGIIMAGGEGTRLRPLTCDCPKPMMQLMNRPVLQYALSLFRRHDIEDIAVTLGYMPDAITDRFGDDPALHLRFFIEKTPLGTAGGVKQAQAFLDEPFVVLSGDGVTDLDITRAAAFHREHSALATLVLVRAENPLDYGVVDLAQDGRVRSFHEKPDWSEVLTDTVNTGIYILEPEVLDRIPEGRPCDFGHELFPQLVREGLPVYGYVTEDYWCDIGDVRAYLGAHMDAMEGRVRLDRLEPLSGRAVQLPGARVDRAAVLEGPCLIGSGARICAGAYVGPYSVIGENCVIGENASVKRSVLWPGARLEAHAQARGCVLAAGAVLREGAQAYEESVLGARAEVGARGVLLSGVKLWPGKRVAPGERLEANRVWGGSREAGFFGGALPLSDPSDAARAAQACVASMKPREVLLGHDGNPLSQALWHAAAAGCMAQGAGVIDAAACTLPVLRHAQRRLGCDAALYISGKGMTPLNARGAGLTDRAQRAISRLNARQDFPRPAPERLPPALEATCAEVGYVADAAGRFRADPDRAATAVLFSPSAMVQALAERVFQRAGLPCRAVCREGDLTPGPGEIGMLLNATGEACALSDENGPLIDAHRQLMIAWVALEAGERTLILRDSATRGIDALLRRYDARAEYLSGEPQHWANALCERQPFQFELHFDGLMLAVAALSLLTEKGLSLDDWRRDMPEVHRMSRTVPIPPRRGGRVLHAFSQDLPGAQLGGGVRFERPDGWAWVGAEEDRSRLRIVTEGTSAEFAGELCDFCEKQIRRLSVET